MGQEAAGVLTSSPHKTIVRSGEGLRTRRKLDRGTRRKWFPAEHDEGPSSNCCPKQFRWAMTHSEAGRHVEKTPRASVKMPGERGGHSGEQTHRCVSRRVVVAAEGVSAAPSWARRRTGARRTSGIGRAAEVRKVAGASTRRSLGRAGRSPPPARRIITRPRAAANASTAPNVNGDRSWSGAVEAGATIIVFIVSPPRVA